jgi:hypothetical protein
MDVSGPHVADIGDAVDHVGLDEGVALAEQVGDAVVIAGP